MRKSMPRCAIVFAIFVNIVLLSLQVRAAPDANFNPKVTINLSDLVTPLCDGVAMTSSSGPPSCIKAVQTDGMDLSNIVSQYGPRKIGSAGKTNEFHRGIDFRYPDMTLDNMAAMKGPGVKPSHTKPVFAAHEGCVHKIEYTNDDTNPIASDGYAITIKNHKCNYVGSDPVFYTRYKHLWAVKGKDADGNAVMNLASNSAMVSDCGGGMADWIQEKKDVAKGQFIGCTGYSANGNHHLHFELRVKSNKNRTAVHPFRLYQLGGKQYSYNLLTDTGAGTITVTISPQQIGQDKEYVTPVRIFPQQKFYDGSTWQVSMQNQTTVNGYIKNPSFIDLELLNHQYTHESRTEASGCPYSADHPVLSGTNGDKIGPDFHFDDGDFNGIIFETTSNSDSSIPNNNLARKFVLKNVKDFSDCYALVVTFSDEVPKTVASSPVVTSCQPPPVVEGSHPLSSSPPVIHLPETKPPILPPPPRPPTLPAIKSR